MENDSKYLLSAYQKKSFDLFNQLIATEAKAQQQQDLIEAQNTKIQEFANANAQLVNEVKKLENHIAEREQQIKNITERNSKRVSKRKPTSESGHIQDAGEF